VDIFDFLGIAVKSKASDLHLSAGLPPMIRLHGNVQQLDLPALNQHALEAMLNRLMSDEQRELLETTLECDFSFEVPDLARFRANMFYQSRGTSAVFRVIPSQVQSLDALNAPAIFRSIAENSHGLVLVTGATGSGKSTTLAAIIDYINSHQSAPILTLEDPIEFLHESKNSLIHQREIGRHTVSYSQALRSALREDPDVILVGEMRDLESIRLALTAAETGHLVLATLHTSSAAKTIDRVVDVFPAGEKEMVRAMLSESLRAVIAQTLCKTNQGESRVAAYEILLGTPAIRHLIRENKVAQIYSAIQTGHSMGMQTLDQHLRLLVDQQKIKLEEAYKKSLNKELFREQISFNT
jgi:twitching motility protein PilT